MDTIKNTVNQATGKQATTFGVQSLCSGYILTTATEKVQEGISGTSKEANKEVAKDSNAGIGTRASAAKDAASDKVSKKQ
jgi:hypothetical protein